MRLVLFAVSIMIAAAFSPAQADPVPRVDPSTYRVETVARGFFWPWSVASLPDGRRLVTESGGYLIALAADGARTLVTTQYVPHRHLTRTSGLMDVAVDPEFSSNGLIYLTLVYGDGEANNTRLVRARLVGDSLHDVRVLFSATPKAGRSNYGGRIAFLPDGTLILTLGDGFDRREDAQNRENHFGKIVRLTREGLAPPDNPFVGEPRASPEIYSLGHRNVQGVVVDADGAILVSEHGPRGGDEINRLTPGGNFGWPIVTNGLDYTFARVSPFRDLPGYERPILEWTPSIAPAGLALYDRNLFPGWRGDLLVPALKERALRRVRRENGRIVGQELLLAERDERMRDVEVAPDGSVYVLTDGPDASLLRLTPAK